MLFVPLLIHRENLKVLLKDVNQQKKALKEKGIHVVGKHHDVEFIGKVCYLMTLCLPEYFASICFCFGCVAEKSTSQRNWLQNVFWAFGGLKFTGRNRCNVFGDNVLEIIFILFLKFRVSGTRWQMSASKFVPPYSLFLYSLKIVYFCPTEKYIFSSSNISELYWYLFPLLIFS